MTVLNSCETQENILAEQNKGTSLYNSAIVDYFNTLKLSVSNNKEYTEKINALMGAIDYNNVKYFDLRTTEKLLIIDLKEFNYFQNAANTKLLKAISILELGQ